MRLHVAAIVAALGVFGCSDNQRASVATPTAPTPVGPAPPSAPAAPARVQGVVLDFQTARPIPGAVVGFSDTPYAIDSLIETTVADANGRYSLSQPPSRGRLQPYGFFVNGEAVGRGYPRGGTYRGDVAVDRGKCIARYGMVLDSETFAPIVGATALDLSNRVIAITDERGWYHVDWGCGVGTLGFNTRWSVMSHPDYQSGTFASGRGISGNYREDVMLVRK